MDKSRALADRPGGFRFDRLDAHARGRRAGLATSDRTLLADVAQQSRDALGRAARLLDLWRDYRGRLASARASALPLKLLDQLFQRPVISGPAAAKHLGVTARSADLAIAKLLRAGLIREATGRRRGRLHLAAGILEAIEAPLWAEESEPTR